MFLKFIEHGFLEVTILTQNLEEYLSSVREEVGCPYTSSTYKGKQISLRRCTNAYKRCHSHDARGMWPPNEERAD